MKKNIKSSLLFAGITIIVSSACTVRAHRPPPPPPAVIKVGKITTPAPVNQEAATYVLQPVNKASDGIPK